MTSAELKEEIAIELENIETVLRELSQLHQNVQGREASYGWTDCTPDISDGDILHRLLTLNLERAKVAEALEQA